MRLPFPLPLPKRKECGGVPCGGAGAIGYPQRSEELLRGVCHLIDDVNDDVNRATCINSDIGSDPFR
jgi:hypothetical protein